jgi:hypothetical protein
MLRVLLALSLLLAAGAGEPCLQFDLQMVEAGGDAPMIVVWAERTDGRFVRTLQMFSKHAKYYPDITTWTAARQDQEPQAQFDAVVGATLKWGSSRRLTVPAVAGGVDILAGDCVLRIEQRKDKGGHYRKRKIPLTRDFAGVTLEKEGYLEKCVITVIR